jgi:deoxyribonuclease-4
LRIGAHLSIAGGLPAAAKMAEEIKANTFQFFTRNPRGGKAREIGADEVAAWEKERVERDIYPIMGHLPYTVNMASPKDEVYDFARLVLTEDLRRCESCGAELLVVHPGSHLGEGVQKGLQRIASLLEEVLSPWEGRAKLLLETMAGQGSEVGTIEDLAWLGEALGWPECLGFCIDSCHLFAAGYDLRTQAGLDQLLEELDQKVSLARVHAVHLNDSKFPLGSGKDRHAPLGKGYIGEEGLSLIINSPHLKHLPFLLETPTEDYREYADEILLLRSLIN